MILFLANILSIVLQVTTNYIYIYIPYSFVYFVFATKHKESLIISFVKWGAYNGIMVSFDFVCNAIKVKTLVSFHFVVDVH